MALFVSIDRLRKFPLSANADHFEFQCKSKAIYAIVFRNVSLFKGPQYETEKGQRNETCNLSHACTCFTVANRKNHYNVTV